MATHKVVRNFKYMYKIIFLLDAKFIFFEYKKLGKIVMKIENVHVKNLKIG